MRHSVFLVTYIFSTQTRYSIEDSYSNEKLEYNNNSTIVEKVDDVKSMVGVRLPEFNQITCENINRYRGGNYTVLFYNILNI